MTDKNKKMTFTDIMQDILKKSYTADNQLTNQRQIVALAIKSEIISKGQQLQPNYDGLVAYAWEHAGYNPKDKKSPAFEMRVIRGVRDALMDYQGYNPVKKKGRFNSDGTINKGFEIGYRLNDNGQLECPDNLLRPTITEKRKVGKKIVSHKGVKNTNYVPVVVPFARMNIDFSKCYPLAKKTREGGKKTPDKPKVLTTDDMVEKLIVAVIKLNPVLVSETRANRFKKLENELFKFFETRALQEGAEIDSEIAEARTGTDN